MVFVVVVQLEKIMFGWQLATAAVDASRLKENAMEVGINFQVTLIPVAYFDFATVYLNT